ncbi:Cys-tRNA(Pro)/Cys-tRNA(Cys) deacylase [Desulfosarcina alkanivorans]|uniref:Cys-tRNA(Pro)/Cys-tRNA(Cys) deacylase n=1 Tax=Desulfosarcina alkanivorans TaxID=571177 RepID=A0A5K7YEI6_9BACT|nr:YbaK/EbsC family protein [Desulfosarcina alkanivorans]BBO66845.1 Cys-tRNA(Pro)/Cys-tRNA(Cys) deacylase [Desulfosarcina alkanivorans]
MAKLRFPVTRAVRFLRSKQVDFKPFLYSYADHGGARQAASELQVPEGRVVKTLVMETGGGAPLLALMHGDRAVSTRRLARFIGSKKVVPVTPQSALRCTGYQVGGISPFGTRQALPVYVQATVLKMKTIFINGGKRGFLVEVEPGVLLKTLSATPVDMSTTLQ